MATENRKRTPELPPGGSVSGTDLVPIWQTAIGLAKVTMSALASYLVPLVAGAQPWVDLPTGATVNLAGTSSPNVRFTGTTTITSCGTGTDGTRRKCRAAAAFTLTNGANLICPGGASIAVAAGDRWEMVLVGTSTWWVENYTRSNGTPLSYTGAPSGMRNRVVNGCMRVDQENAAASVTITAAAALKWVADVHYAWCTGANVTAQVVTNAAGQNRLRFTGAASNTLVGLGHRIERINCADLANGSANLSVTLASSSLTTIAWEVYRANANDTFGSIASPSRTLLGSGTFTGITATEARYNASIAIPAAATTGIEIVLKSTAGLLAAATLDIGELQLEAGSYANSFERRPVAVELSNVQRYYERVANAFSLQFPCPSTGGFGHTFQLHYKTTKRVAVTPTANASSGVNLASGSVVNFDTWGFTYQAVGTGSSNTSMNLTWSTDARLAS